MSTIYFKRDKLFCALEFNAEDTLNSCCGITEVGEFDLYEYDHIDDGLFEDEDFCPWKDTFKEFLHGLSEDDLNGFVMTDKEGGDADTTIFQHVPKRPIEAHGYSWKCSLSEYFRNPGSGNMIRVLTIVRTRLPRTAPDKKLAKKS